MRLIDADELKKVIPDVEPDSCEYCGLCEMLNKSDVEDFIDEQPTAYDIENVVTQIRKLKDFDPDGDINPYSRLIDEDEVVDIILRGGVE